MKRSSWSVTNAPEGAGDVGEGGGPVMKGVLAWGEIIILILASEPHLTDNIGPFSGGFRDKAVLLIILDIDTSIYADIIPFSSIFLQGIDSVQL